MMTSGLQEMEKLLLSLQKNILLGGNQSKSLLDKTELKHLKPYTVTAALILTNQSTGKCIIKGL